MKKTGSICHLLSIQLVLFQLQSYENLAESLVTFYKDYKFNSHAAIRVCIPNQPVLDSGGVRSI